MMQSLNIKNKYYVIGLMSGSSLDGLDMVYCAIENTGKYNFDLIVAETFEYDVRTKNYLKNIAADINKDYEKEHYFFAEITAEFINKFIEKNKINIVDFIASHGHTIFHYPENKKTLQIGDGKRIMELTGISTIYNFRQADIDAGGQGTPLVPVCDQMFFSNYDACLNIGGIANISYNIDGERLGFDICAANQLLNYCAAELNMQYDEDGKLASAGDVNDDLLEQLNDFDYFRKTPPKSLDNNHLQKYFFPLLDKFEIRVEDKLNTVVEHIAVQIAKMIMIHRKVDMIPKEDYNLLVTGGGAFNKYLIENIEIFSGIKIKLPDVEIIQFKEALAMALMGVLRWENNPNFLPSVTGANHAVCAGEIYLAG